MVGCRSVGRLSSEALPAPSGIYARVYVPTESARASEHRREASIVVLLLSALSRVVSFRFVTDARCYACRHKVNEQRLKTEARQFIDVIYCVCLLYTTYITKDKK